jgi:hypothetical protein
VDKLNSILAVIDSADESLHVVLTAMVLARHFGARLELLLCNSESAFALRHAAGCAGDAAAVLRFARSVRPQIRREHGFPHPGL